MIWAALSKLTAILSCRLCIFVVCIILNGNAIAGDYTVSYALDAGDLNEAGTKHDCIYNQGYFIKIDKLDLTVMIDVYPSNRNKDKKVRISAYGGRSRLDCCFFPDGVEDLSFELREPFVRVGLYEGRARRRNEFIRNSPLGLLYLQFSDMN
jgi:hypothetical protein